MAGLILSRTHCFVIMAAFAVVITGCGGPAEDNKPESSASVAASNEASAQWSPEMKEKYKQSMVGHAKTFGGAGSKTK